MKIFGFIIFLIFQSCVAGNAHLSVVGEGNASVQDQDQDQRQEQELLCEEGAPSSIPACPIGKSIQHLNHADGFDSSGKDFFTSVVVDNDGNIFAAGGTKGSLFESNAGLTDIILVKYDKNCNFIFGKQIGTASVPVAGGAAGSEFVYPNGLRLGSDGSIFISGSTNSSLGETNAGSYDGFWAKFSKDGDLEFVKQFGLETGTAISESFAEYEDVEAFETDDSAVYVHVKDNHSLLDLRGQSLSIYKYDYNGNLIWKRLYNMMTEHVIHDSLTGNKDIRNMKIGPNGNLFVFGHTSTNDFLEVKSGDLLFTNQYDLFHGEIDTNTGDIVRMQQFGSVRTPLELNTDGSESVGEMVIDHSNGSYFLIVNSTGDYKESNSGGQDIAVSKFDKDGNYLWSKHYGASSGGTVYHDKAESGVIVGGELIIGANTYGNFGDTNLGVGVTRDILILRLDKETGEENAKIQLGSTLKSSWGVLDTSKEDELSEITADKCGNIYIVGSTDSDFMHLNPEADGDAIMMKLKPDFSAP